MTAVNIAINEKWILPENFFLRFFKSTIFLILPERSEALNTDVNQMALKTVNEGYPPSSWIHIYTDRSSRYTLMLVYIDFLEEQNFRKLTNDFEGGIT